MLIVVFSQQHEKRWWKSVRNRSVWFERWKYNSLLVYPYLSLDHNACCYEFYHRVKWNQIKLRICFNHVLMTLTFVLLHTYRFLTIFYSDRVAIRNACVMTFFVCHNIKRSQFWRATFWTERETKFWTLLLDVVSIRVVILNDASSGIITCASARGHVFVCISATVIRAIS